MYDYEQTGELKWAAVCYNEKANNYGVAHAACRQKGFLSTSGANKPLSTTNNNISYLK